MNSGRILVVDDEPQLRRVMRTALTSNGYEVLDARSGEEALHIVRAESPDLILLDMNMPGMGGLAACAAIRAISDAGIIILSVRGSEQDKIAALDAGADDYMTKPYSLDELFARIRANLRRLPVLSESTPPIVVSDELTIDLSGRVAIVRGKPVRLTPKEFDLLQFLVSHPNKPVAHRKLLQTVWGPTTETR
jgi:two-component system KDP operon response regulator KdpE